MMEYLNCRVVDPKIESAGYSKVSPPGLVSPFDIQTMITMAQAFILLNAEC